MDFLYTDEYFMAEALKEATLALEKGEVPVGAVVVCNNKIIGRAHNQTEMLGDATAHAEMLAITSASNYLGSKYLSDCTLYVSLEPCPMCAGAMNWSQLKKLVFGVKDPERGFQKVKPSVLHPKTEVLKGIKKEECKTILNDFFVRIRNK